MIDFRKRRWLTGWIVAFIVLSFFYMEPTARAAGAAHLVTEGRACAAYLGEKAGASGEIKSPALIDTGKNQVPQQNGRVSADRMIQNTAAARVQGGSLPFRLLAVTVLLFWLIRETCRMLMRRFCPCAIALWQNIYYIHRVDGEKEKHSCKYIG